MPITQTLALTVADLRFYRRVIERTAIERGGVFRPDERAALDKLDAAIAGAGPASTDSPAIALSNGTVKSVGAHGDEKKANGNFACDGRRI
jgi:hypothetical protein